MHHRECKNITSLSEKDRARLIEVNWEGFENSVYEVTISVEAFDRPKITPDVMALINDSQVHIMSITSRVKELSVQDVGGSVLSVSQFTLFGDCRRGRRPSFTEAAPPAQGDALYEAFNRYLRDNGLHVETGQFQAHMEVSLINDGPVTMLLDSTKQF